MAEFSFPVIYMIDDEQGFGRMFQRRSPDEVEWLRRCLGDPDCVVFNAPRPLYADISLTHERQAREMPGAPTGYFVAAVWPMRDKWNAGHVRSNHDDKAAVLRLVTAEQARQMLLDSVAGRYREIYQNNPDLFEEHWRQSFYHRFNENEQRVTVTTWEPEPAKEAV